MPTPAGAKQRQPFKLDGDAEIDAEINDVIKSMWAKRIGAQPNTPTIGYSDRPAATYTTVSHIVKTTGGTGT